jgi:targeting protein for Xklp2
MQILESKGDIGVFVHPKSQVTAPKEFRFCTDVRLGPPSVADLFDKVFIYRQPYGGIVTILFFFVKILLSSCPILQLSLHSECSSNSNRQGVPRCTIPNPFSLQTEVREM